MHIIGLSLYCKTLLAQVADQVAVLVLIYLVMIFHHNAADASEQLKRCVQQDGILSPFAV